MHSARREPEPTTCPQEGWMAQTCWQELSLEEDLLLGGGLPSGPRSCPPSPTHTQAHGLAPSQKTTRHCVEGLSSKAVHGPPEGRSLGAKGL